MFSDKMIPQHLGTLFFLVKELLDFFIPFFIVSIALRYKNIRSLLIVCDMFFCRGGVTLSYFRYFLEWS